MLFETIITDAKRCSTLLVHTDTPHHNILIASLAVHFGGAVSVLTYQIRFIEKVGLDVF